jgi:hypothetical protein
LLEEDRKSALPVSAPTEVPLLVQPLGWELALAVGEPQA